jgi:hypothetical protein
VEINNTFLNAYTKVDTLNEDFNLTFILSNKKKTLINKLSKADNKPLSEVFKIHPSTLKFSVNNNTRLIVTLKNKWILLLFYYSKSILHLWWFFKPPIFYH